MKKLFKKGNPGKPKGAKNKKSLQLRETISNFLNDNFEIVVNDFKTLDPKDRSKLYVDLLPYSISKLQSVTMDMQFDQLSDEQINSIIETLKQSAK